MRPVVSHREKVQLAAGLQNGVLSDDAMARGLNCISQFRQILDSAQPDMLRVVGTNTFRAAKNGAVFEDAAATMLRQRIEVISGREEARLIYLGVAHSLADDDEARLVVDIGGGSTEFIIGERFESKLLESLYMGCVSYREQFFPNGELTVRQFEKAYQSASLEVLTIRNTYRNKGWSEAVGSAGTLNAIARVLGENNEQGLISRQGLEDLKATVCSIRSFEGLKEVPGLKSHRRSTFVPGLAICCALFDTLGVEEMRVSSGGLREGMVYDLMGRMAHEDVRERTVTAMMKRCDVDQGTAIRVEQFGNYLYNKTREAWCLSDADGELLSWAARLHEVGLSIAHSQFHKHGQYLIKNADLPGFSQTEQKALAILVRCHRRKLSVEPFTGMVEEERQGLLRLCILLRLAVLFKYVIPVEGLPHFKVAVDDNCCTLSFEPGWLQKHPLTMAELEAEQRYSKDSGFVLSVT
ncbi:MAG: Ppx/GppA family phosphatase [Porticoccaceae bacterium]|nr:Ppx/GppA family phosphatase [Porticoccaceae bacterium]